MSLEAGRFELPLPYRRFVPGAPGLYYPPEFALEPASGDFQSQTGTPESIRGLNSSGYDLRLEGFRDRRIH